MERSELRDLSARPKAERMEVRRAFAEAAMGGVGRGSAVMMPNDERVEWRGMVDGLRTRLVVDGLALSLGVKFNNDLGELSLAWNRSWVEDPGPGEAWDDDDDVRIFIAKGACIATTAAFVGEQVATADLLPRDSLTTMGTVMSDHYLGRIELDEDGLEVEFDRDLSSLLGDPVQAVASAVRGVASVCVAWAAVELTPQQRATLEAAGETTGFEFAGSPPRLVCRYCSTTFVPGITSNCPNCGAPG